jgi:hypothetical protein
MVSDESDGLVHRQPALARDPLPQRLAGEVGHDAVEEAARVARVVQRQDVGVVERRGGPDLSGEAIRTQERGGWRRALRWFRPWRDQGGGSLVFGVALSYIWAVIRDHSALASPLALAAPQVTKAEVCGPTAQQLPSCSFS